MRLFLVSLLLLGTTHGHAMLNIYLYPSADVSGRKISIKDIASIEADTKHYDIISRTTVPERMLSDGLIDRSEIISLVRSHTDQLFLIFGTAVRIRKKNADQKKRTLRQPRLLERGRAVTLIVRKKGIRIEMRGKVLKNCFVGDVVPVQLERYGSVRGRVINREEVELCL